MRGHIYAVFTGITMYAVGVGKAVEDELRVIASEPVEKHFFYTSDFSAIKQIAENLKLNVCPGIWKKKILVFKINKHKNIFKTKEIYI